MQFGPCIHCKRIILITTGIEACCGTCHILSGEDAKEHLPSDNQDENHQQQQQRNSRNEQESNVINFDRNDNHAEITAAATTTTIADSSRPNVIDLQTAIGREDLPQMLQRFLSFFNQDSQTRGASESDIATLTTRILDIYDLECRTECAICTESFETMELTKLPCNHEYHSECIHHWLKLNSSCPMCRQSISTKQPISTPPPIQNEPDLIIMRREMADRMYQENAPLHYMDDVD